MIPIRMLMYSRISQSCAFLSMFLMSSHFPFLFGCCDCCRQPNDVQQTEPVQPLLLEAEVVQLEPVTISYNFTQTTVQVCKLAPQPFWLHPSVLLEWLCFCTFGESSVCKERKKANETTNGLLDNLWRNEKDTHVSPLSIMNDVWKVSRLPFLPSQTMQLVHDTEWF